MALFVNYTALSQSVTIDTALTNATKDIVESVSKGTKIAILNIESDYMNLSDYIINELIVNLVNTKQFQIVPRRTVELEAANREFGFQMTGYVSDESQKRLGQFLGAGTIITGSVKRDSANSFRLVINSIDLESFTFQSSFRASLQNDRHVKTLIADSGGVIYEDYTVGERLGIGAANIFFGIGSHLKGQKSAWIVTVLDTLAVTGLVLGGIYGDDKGYLPYRTIGTISIVSGIAIGFIIPFFHHKPNQTVSQNNFPFNLELVSSNNQNINGV